MTRGHDILANMSTTNLDRSNASNTGMAFQTELEMACRQYRSQLVAAIEKVSPPSRVVGTGYARRVIFTANPFLDFVGTWTEFGGRAIFLEAKSTATHRLPLARPGGVTEDQVHALVGWKIAGAAAMLVWRFGGATALFTPQYVVDRATAGEKSLVFENGTPIPRTNRTHLDFLAAYSEVEK